MLLVDGCPNTVEDLRVYESGILDVSSTERVDLKTKLALATEEVSEEVLDFLLGSGRSQDPRQGVGDPNAGAVRRRTGVTDVVITRQLKRWHALHTITLVYRDALHNQLNGRYGQQYQQYLDLTLEAREQTRRFGIGISLNPVPVAQVPTIISANVALQAAIYYVRVSWIGALGQEGQPSELTAFEADSGTGPVITAVNPPAGATGFNVYVSLTLTDLALQNSSPVVAGESFSVPASGLVAGSAPGMGQDPDVWVTGAQINRRG